MRCIGCQCTTERACPGGCSWVSISPPKCSACVDSGKLKLPSRREKHEASIERCDATGDGQHVLFWLNPRSGFCEACRLAFVATEVA